MLNEEAYRTSVLLYVEYNSVSVSVGFLPKRAMVYWQTGMSMHT